MKIASIIIAVVVIIVIASLFLFSLLSWQIQNSPSVVSECEGMGYFETIKCTVSQYK
ncbi:MAG: hypothetical protein ABH846_00575 [Patescibacteria group bacterium]